MRITQNMQSCKAKTFNFQLTLLTSKNKNSPLAFSFKISDFWLSVFSFFRNKNWKSLAYTFQFTGFGVIFCRKLRLDWKGKNKIRVRLQFQVFGFQLALKPFPNEVNGNFLLLLAMTVLFGIDNVFRKRLTTWIVFQQLKIMQLENATLKLVLLKIINISPNFR